MILKVCVFVFPTHTMTVSNEITTPYKFIKSRYSHSSVQIQIIPKSQIQFVLRDTEKFEFFSIWWMSGMCVCVCVCIFSGNCHCHTSYTHSLKLAWKLMYKYMCRYSLQQKSARVLRVCERVCVSGVRMRCTCFELVCLRVCSYVHLHDVIRM